MALRPKLPRAAGLAAACAALACAPTAGAATVSTVSVPPRYGDGPTDMLRFAAAPGERNDVTIAYAPGADLERIVTVTDSGPLTPGGRCSIVVPASEPTARCVLGLGSNPGLPTRLSLGDAPDDLRITGVAPLSLPPFVISDGRGADEVRTSAHPTRFTDDRGNDVLRGGAADDVFLGGPGRDFAACGRGEDRVVAGPRDRVRGCERVRRTG